MDILDAIVEQMEATDMRYNFIDWLTKREMAAEADSQGGDIAIQTPDRAAEAASQAGDIALQTLDRAALVHNAARAASTTVANLAPQAEADRVPLQVRALDDSSAVTTGEVPSILVLEPSMRNLTMEDDKDTNSMAKIENKLLAPAAAVGNIIERSPKRAEGYMLESYIEKAVGSPAKETSSHEAAPAEGPLTHLKERVEKAFGEFEKTLGVTADEREMYSAQMEIETLITLKAMNIIPTPHNYTLGFKATRQLRLEATEKGTVSDELVYWYMAGLYAQDQKPGGEHKLADFVNPNAEHVAKVRALIHEEYGTGAA